MNEWVTVIVGHHEDQCHSLSWASNLGSDYDIIASGGQDNQILVWQRDTKRHDWEKRSLIPTDFPVINVAWNQSGPVVLQVTLENGVTQLYKEQIIAKGDWDLMATIDTEGVVIEHN
mmetsp:Transcript_7416/g.6573  ORF Transcript_7416/g.6573 Transcript_7416/m.6573 type:complete len:117 (+) Transcript_7416:679-1029(+)